MSHLQALPDCMHIRAGTHIAFWCFKDRFELLISTCYVRLSTCMIFSCVCVMVLELGTEQGSAGGSPEKTAR